MLSLGIERIKDLLYTLLIKLLREEFGAEITVLYERNEAAIRPPINTAVVKARF